MKARRKAAPSRRQFRSTGDCAADAADDFQAVVDDSRRAIARIRALLADWQAQSQLAERLERAAQDIAAAGRSTADSGPDLRRQLMDLGIRLAALEGALHRPPAGTSADEAEAPASLPFRPAAGRSEAA